MQDVGSMINQLSKKISSLVNLIIVRRRNDTIKPLLKFKYTSSLWNTIATNSWSLDIRSNRVGEQTFKTRIPEDLKNI